jgi:hypothetical protein
MAARDVLYASFSKAPTRSSASLPPVASLHADSANARRGVRQGFIAGVETEIDNMTDAERVAVFGLRIGRLPSRRDAVIEKPPIVNAFGVSHQGSVLASQKEEPGGEPG